MKYCTNCGLPESLPSSRIDGSGTCYYCRTQASASKMAEKRESLRNRFADLLEQKRGSGPVDILVAYSGGKDSTYTLHLLKTVYKARVATFTMDHGFIPEQTFRNIRTVVGALDMDWIHIRPRPELLRQLFRIAAFQNPYPPKSLERANPVCTVCMAIVKAIALRMALCNGVPFLGYGWSPGQAPIQSSLFRMPAEMLEQSQRSLFDPLIKVCGRDQLASYLLDPKSYRDEENIPYQVNPLGFHDYEESEILSLIKTLGWKRPEGIDPNSSNCELNSFAVSNHTERFGYHPYAFEMASLVRQGALRREEAIHRQETPPPQDLVDRAGKWLEDPSG